MGRGLTRSRSLHAFYDQNFIEGRPYGVPSTGVNRDWKFYRRLNYFRETLGKMCEKYGTKVYISCLVGVCFQNFLQIGIVARNAQFWVYISRFARVDRQLLQAVELFQGKYGKKCASLVQLLVFCCNHRSFFKSVSCQRPQHSRLISPVSQGLIVNIFENVSLEFEKRHRAAHPDLFFYQIQVPKREICIALQIGF